MGKSTLAIAAVHDRRVAVRFGWRRFFTRLDAASSASDVLLCVAAALGVESPSDLKAALFARLASAPVLLILDNLDAPLNANRAGVEAFLGELIAHAPHTSICATVQGSDYPAGVSWSTPIEAQPLSPAEARSVFLHIAGKGFESDPGLAGLLSGLDGIPLAINLLAHRALAEPNLTKLAQQWNAQRSRPLLVGQTAGSTDILRAAFEIAIQGPWISDVVRRFLSILALMPNGIGCVDLPTVFGEAPTDATEASNVLCHAGMAFIETGRVRLHALVREYVVSHLPPSDADYRRVADRYLEMAKLGDSVRFEGGWEAVARMTPEALNIARVVDLEMKQPSPIPAIDAVLSLAEFYSVTGMGATTLMHRCADRAEELSEHGRAALLHYRAGDIELQRNEYESAFGSFEGALPLYRSSNDASGEASCLWRLGDISFYRRNYPLARKNYESALALFKGASDVLGEANCIKSLGDIAFECSDVKLAKKSYEDALPLYKSVDAAIGEANCVKCLGNIALRHRDHEAARLHFEQALPLFRQANDPLGEANCIMGLGHIARRRRDHKTAWARFHEALPLFRRVGCILGEANCIQSLGDVALRRRDNESACKIYLTALNLYERIPEPYSIGVTHWRLSAVTPERREHLKAAREAWESIGRQDLIAEYLGDKGLSV
jgi:tetratricopeptide (TPR) repeat protein